MFQSTAKWAKINHFKLLRNDCGAFEYVATRKTPKDYFEECIAFTLHNYIFYSSMRVAKTASVRKHELEHVRQNNEVSGVVFDIWYTIETLLFGYKGNKFEKAALAAEKKRKYPDVGESFLTRLLR
jgi:hypothetical protein